MNNKQLYSCWPDGFSRYYSISEALKDVYSKNDKLSILDVGGNSTWMYEFLKDTGLDFKLSVLDTRKPDLIDKNVNYIQKDFFTTTIESNSYRVVINTDVIEHVPKNLKLTFIRKSIDVARDLIIFSAPQQNKHVEELEHEINNYYSFINNGDQQPWLKEHFKYGRFNVLETENIIKELGYDYIKADTNNLTNWFLSFSLNLVNEGIAPIEGMDCINKFYNENIQSIGDYSNNGYRKMIIVFKNHKLKQIFEKNNKYLSKSTNQRQEEFVEKTTINLMNAIIHLKKSYDYVLEANKRFDTMLNSEKKKNKKLEKIINDYNTKLDLIRNRTAYKLIRPLYDAAFGKRK